jgi:anti-sigma regulatory factor (Ser/Thr protein kinase)
MALDSSPLAVQEARRWAGDVCREVGRPELSETAELAITELVTNAVLHAKPPMSLRVAGTFDHPRFEVADGSRVVPSVNPRMTDDDELLSTFGRGLGLVAMCALSWGVDVHDDGKIVWFEPDEQVAETPSDPVIDLPSDETPRYPAEVPDDYETVVFDAMPVRLLADFRRHFQEVRRELRLLALAHEADYPVAKSLTQLFERVDEMTLAMRGLDDLDAAIAAGVDRADIVFRVPPGSADTMTQLLDLLELADEFCRSQRLLTLAATPQQFQLQRWYLSEFQRQSRGEPPLAWAGTYQVDPSYRQSAS